MPFIPDEETTGFTQEAPSVTLQSEEEMKTKGLLGKIGSFLGIEKVGRRIGSELAKIDPNQRKNLEYIKSMENQGLIEEGVANQLSTGNVNNRQALASAGQLALNLVPVTKVGSAALRAGGKLLPQMARSAALGAGMGATSALQQKETSVKDVLLNTVVGGATGAAIPLAGKILSKGVEGIKSLPERMYNTIYKDAKTDWQAFVKSGAIVDLQKNNPAQFKELVDKGIIKLGAAGEVKVNPTLASEALERGMKGSAETQAKYAITKQFELENEVRKIATDKKLVSLPNKNGYVKLLNNLTKDFKTYDYGFQPERMSTAKRLASEIVSSPTGKVTAETALETRRFLDGLRIQKSFSTPGAPMAVKQEVLKDAANSIRTELYKTPGLKKLMNEYRFFIEAFDSIADTGIRRQNAKVVNLADLLIGGGGMMAGGGPIGSIGAVGGMRAVQSPSFMTGAAQVLNKSMKAGIKPAATAGKAKLPEFVQNLLLQGRSNLTSSENQ